MILYEEIKREILIKEERFTEVSCDFCDKKFEFDENNSGDWIEVEFKFPNGKLYIGEICKKCFNKNFKEKLRFIDRFEEFEKPDLVNIVKRE